MNLSDQLIAAAATAAGPAPEDLNGDKFSGWKDRVSTIAANLAALGQAVAEKVANAVTFPDGTTDHKTFDWNDVVIDRVEEAGASKRLRVFFQVPEHLQGKFTDKDGTESVMTLRSFEDGGEAQQALAKSLVGKNASFVKLSFIEDGEKRNLLANLRPAGDTTAAEAPADEPTPTATADDSAEKAAERQRKADEANAAQAAEEAAEEAGVSFEDALAIDAENVDPTYDGIVKHAQAIKVDRATLRDLARSVGVDSKDKLEDEALMVKLREAVVSKGRELAKAGGGTLPEAEGDEVF